MSEFKELTTLERVRTHFAGGYITVETINLIAQATEEAAEGYREAAKREQEALKLLDRAQRLTLRVWPVLGLCVALLVLSLPGWLVIILHFWGAL